MLALPINRKESQVPYLFLTFVTLVLALFLKHALWGSVIYVLWNLVIVNVFHTSCISFLLAMGLSVVLFFLKDFFLPQEK